MHLLQTATQTFLYSLLHGWAEAGLLQASEGTLAVAPNHQPLPVRIENAGSAGVLYYQAHVEDSCLRTMKQNTWSGRTHLVRNPEEAIGIVQQILSRAAQQQQQGGGDPSERVLGFDVEFKPRWSASLPESPPTVIQVCMRIMHACGCVCSMDA